MPAVVRNVSRTTGAAPLRSSLPLISVEAARFLLASGCTQNVSVTSLIVTALYCDGDELHRVDGSSRHPSGSGFAGRGGWTGVM